MDEDKKNRREKMKKIPKMQKEVKERKRRKEDEHEGQKHWMERMKTVSKESPNGIKRSQLRKGRSSDSVRKERS